MTTAGEFSLTEKVSLLLKVFFNKPFTRDTLEFFAEPGIGFSPILSSQVWQSAENIPTIVPTDLVGTGATGTIEDLEYPLLGSNGTDINNNTGGLISTSDPVVALYINMSTTHVAGTTYTFKAINDENGNSVLIDAIPFNYGGLGRYNYVLRDANGTFVNFGSTGGHWVIDNANGYITFFHTIDGSYNIDANNTPTISFFRYVGEKGVGNTNPVSSGITVTETDQDPISINTTTIQFNSPHHGLTVTTNNTGIVDIDLIPQQFSIGSNFGSTTTDLDNLIVEGRIGVGFNNPNSIANDYPNINNNKPIRIITNGSILANGPIFSRNFLTTSDLRWKTDIEILEKPLNKLLQLQGIKYLWTDEAINKFNYDNDKKEIGVIAQDVEKVFPELVMNTIDGYKLVDYPKLTAVIIEAIKELNDKMSN